jgi:O-methyltransferase
MGFGKGATMFVAAQPMWPVQYSVLWERFSPFSMIPRPNFYDNLALIDWIAKHSQAAFVECGTWKGGMSAAMMSLGGKSREYHFFDSFQGLPPTTEEDGENARNWQADGSAANFFDNCTANLQEFMNVIKSAGEYPDPKVYAGWFDKTVPSAQTGPIALLRLDGDWYESTMTCLEHLFPKLVPGGLCIIDDYDYWEGCTRAVHDYLSQKKVTASIQRTPYARVAYILAK